MNIAYYTATALANLHPKENYPRGAYPLAPRNREQWEAYDYNPSDTRPNVVPKPTWREIVMEILQFVPRVISLNSWFHEELLQIRHHQCEQMIREKVFGIDRIQEPADNEAYVRRQLDVEETGERKRHRQQTLDYRRRRYHQIEDWILSLDSVKPASLTFEQVEELCMMDYMDEKLWTRPFTPTMGKVKRMSEIQFPKHYHPGPPPEWKPEIRRLWSDRGNNVRFSVMLAYRTDITFIPRPSGEAPEGLTINVGDRTLTINETAEVGPAEPLEFTVTLPEGVNETELGFQYSIKEYDVSGRQEFHVEVPQ